MDEPLCGACNVMAIAQEELTTEKKHRPFSLPREEFSAKRILLKLKNLQAGHVLDQASGATPLQMKRARQSQFSGRRRSRKTWPTAFPPKKNSAAGIGWAR